MHRKKSAKFPKYNVFFCIFKYASPRPSRRLNTTRWGRATPCSPEDVVDGEKSGVAHEEELPLVRRQRRQALHKAEFRHRDNRGEGQSQHDTHSRSLHSQQHKT